MDCPILTYLMSPFSVLGASGVNFNYYSFLMKIKSVNRIAPDGMPRFAASHLGLFCLSMSHKKDARFIWVKHKNWCIFFMDSVYKLNRLLSVFLNEPRHAIMVLL